MISTAGLPVAMSRMISQASSLKHYNQVRRIYHTARGIFLGLGIAYIIWYAGGGTEMLLSRTRLTAQENE